MSVVRCTKNGNVRVKGSCNRNITDSVCKSSTPQREIESSKIASKINSENLENNQNLDNTDNTKDCSENNIESEIQFFREEIEDLQTRLEIMSDFMLHLKDIFSIAYPKGAPLCSPNE